MTNNALKKPKQEAGPDKEKRLTPETVKKYLTRGGGNFSDQDLLMFIALTEEYGLNPWVNDCYLVKYSQKQDDPATIVISFGAYQKRADTFPYYEGFDAGVLVVNEDGSLEEREGSMVIEGEKLVGGWARVYRKDRRPHYLAVSFDEYVGRKKDGTPNSQWAGKPGTMIRKVAASQCLREAFPQQMNNLYTVEEMDQAANDVITTEVVEHPAEPHGIEHTPDWMQSGAQIQQETTPEPVPTEPARQSRFQ